jgi:hypothetical protein
MAAYRSVIAYFWPRTTQPYPLRMRREDALPKTSHRPLRIK